MNKFWLGDYVNGQVGTIFMTEDGRLVRVVKQSAVALHTAGHWEWEIERGIVPEPACPGDGMEVGVID